MKKELFQKGVALFNQGHFWEAHEAWEEIWLETDRKGKLGIFLAGLIQLAACHLKIEKNQPEIAKKLAKNAAKKLKNSPFFYDFDPKPWLLKIQNYFKEEL